MAKGMALTIGLNSVDPAHYGGWSGNLVACEEDAKDMAHIAKTKKFAVKALFTKSATRKQVFAEIEKAAQTLKSGDIFAMSFSGHGGQVPDLNSDEVDKKDETMCLYDGELIDDELYGEFAKFAPGVRILVFSDSCHSGTNVKAAYYRGRAAAPRYRNMPLDVEMKTYLQNQDFYDRILKDPRLKAAQDAVKASILLISGCQDNQLSADGDSNGLFTGTLLAVWRNGKFKGDYKKFRNEIANLMPPEQSPNYYRAGVTDKKFEKQTPFTI